MNSIDHRRAPLLLAVLWEYVHEIGPIDCYSFQSSLELMGLDWTLGLSTLDGIVATSIAASIRSRIEERICCGTEGQHDTIRSIDDDGCESLQNWFFNSESKEGSLPNPSVDDAIVWHCSRLTETTATDVRCLDKSASTIAMQ